MPELNAPYSVHGPAGPDNDFAIRDQDGFIVAETFGRVAHGVTPDAGALARRIVEALNREATEEELTDASQAHSLR